MKLQIIREASIHGVKRTLEKYGIYQASYYWWKNIFNKSGFIITIFYSKNNDIGEFVIQTKHNRRL